MRKTQYEELIEDDLQVKKIEKEMQLKLQKLEVANSDQEKILRKGKPMPVLAPDKQFQSSSKSVNDLRDKKKKVKLSIEVQAMNETNVRVKELQKENPEIYREHIIEKQRQLQEEKKKMLHRQHER